MKKVLIITYHFPPDAAVGAVRPAKFAKYLPEFGWEPIIYTVKDKFYETLDLTKFEEELKNIEIYRTNLIPGPLKLYSSLIHKRIKSPPKSVLPQLIKTNNQDGVGYIKRFFSSMLRLPDDKQGWIANIIIDGYRIMKKHKIDTFITTGPPMSTHVGGLLLRSVTHAKWVADFRDPWWTAAHWRGERYRTKLSDAMGRKLETKVIRKADLVITTAPRVTDYFKSNLPSSRQEKCITITNGYDESDFTGIARTSITENRKIRICHAGILYVGRNPKPFLEALQKLSFRNEINKDHLEVEFIGGGAYYNDVSILGLIEKYQLESFVRVVERMPFKACIERLINSSALLLFAQDYPEQIPAKVFEYLRMNKPIFAITNEGDTKQILESFSNVFIADPGKIDDVAEKFSQMLEAIKNNRKYLGTAENIRKYDRRNLTKKLALCLNQIDKGYHDLSKNIIDI